MCNRLSGNIREIFANTYIRSNNNFTWKIDYWICSIRNNRFVNLHSEVLRYSSSASTVRPLFEYLRIRVYDFNLKRNVNVTVVTIYIYVGDENNYDLHVRGQ